MPLSVRFHFPYSDWQQTSSWLEGLLGAISGAKEELRLCAVASTHPAVLKAAQQASQRRVKVLWVIQGGDAASEKALEQAGFKKDVAWKAFSREPGALKQSFAVVDQQRIWLSPAPWTLEAATQEDHLSVAIESHDLALAFGKAWEAEWNSPITSTRGPEAQPELIAPSETVEVGPELRATAYFQPYDGRILLESAVDLIEQAEERILFALPSLADGRIGAALEDKARLGIHVEGVLDARRSKLSQLLGVPKLKKLAMQGALAAAKGTAMNLRVIVCDRQWVWIGTSDLSPDESPYTASAGLLIESPSIALHCEHAIEALHQRIREGELSKPERSRFSPAA